MATYDAYVQKGRVKLLLLGEPKSGKTGLIASLANAGYSVGIMDVDNNLGILETYLAPGHGKISAISIPAREPGSWTKAKTLLTSWKDFQDDLGDPRKWNSNTVFVVDSATFLGEICLASVLADNKVDIEKGQFDIGLYGVLQKRFENFVADLCSADYLCHVIFIAHLRDLQDKASGILKTQPAFPGQQLPRTVARYCNNVFLTTRSEEGKPVLQTTSTKKMAYLGSSAPKKIKEVEAFDLGSIFKRIQS